MNVLLDIVDMSLDTAPRFRRRALASMQILSVEQTVLYYWPTKRVACVDGRSAVALHVGHPADGSL